MLDFLLDITPESQLYILLIEAVPITIGILYVLGNRRARHRLQKARYARSVLVEISNIDKRLDKIINKKITDDMVPMYTGDIDRIRDFQYIFPRNVYDGLVSSANISYFDRNTQEKLHEIYNAKIGSVIARIKRYKRDAVGNYEFVFDHKISDPKKWVKEIKDDVENNRKAVEEFYNKNRSKGMKFLILKALRLEYDD